MYYEKSEITKEQYDRIKDTSDGKTEAQHYFGDSLQYQICGAHAFQCYEKNGKYYIKYQHYGFD